MPPDPADAAGEDPLDALHPQVRSLLRAMADVMGDATPTGGEPSPADLAAERAEYLDGTIRFGGAAEPVAEARDVVIPAADGARLPGKAYVPLHAADTDALIVWLHGGGWYVGDIPTFDRVARTLANAAGAKVVLVEYRLAPEHRWPTQVHDADAIVAWARSAGAEQLGVDPARVLVGGDSAGGQLATVAARHAASDGLPPLAGLLVAYPALDPALSSASAHAFADGPMLTLADMRRCWDVYLDGADATDPDIAPLLASDLVGLPPTWIAVAGQDLLRDDGVTLHDRLTTAGVRSDIRIFDDMVHGFIRWGGVVDAAGDALRWLADGARAALES
jgi:acetyl esterase